MATHQRTHRDLHSEQRALPGVADQSAMRAIGYTAAHAAVLRGRP